jgi:DNA-directed RNA polymerase subunit RPC12/RpoP
MKIKDVTDQVDFENNDDEFLPLTKCVCGHRFHAWDFMLSIYDNDPHECPHCGAKLFFSNAIRVYEIIRNNDNWDSEPE